MIPSVDLSWLVDNNNIFLGKTAHTWTFSLPLIKQTVLEPLPISCINKPISVKIKETKNQAIHSKNFQMKKNNVHVIVWYISVVSFPLNEDKFKLWFICNISHVSHVWTISHVSCQPARQGWQNSQQNNTKNQAGILKKRKKKGYKKQKQKGEKKAMSVWN